MTTMTRRGFLAGSGTLAAGLLGATTAGCTGARTGARGEPGTAPARPRQTTIVTTGRWPGHTEGLINLGASSDRPLEDVEQETGPLGTARRFFQWNETDLEFDLIRVDHAAHRLPWVSFKPPTTGPGGWVEVADGVDDEGLRDRARRYAALAGPVVVTFHHEPHHDETGTGAQFVKAWTRVHDVMEDETGLQNVALVPIIGEWLFNPEGNQDKASPRQYVGDQVLDRCAFLGIDIYQNASGTPAAERLDRVVDWLGRQGYPDTMIGIGEAGATDQFGEPEGAQWWEGLWSWAEANTSRLGVVSYYNSSRNNAPGVEWPLGESRAKLAAFRASLASAVACLLP